ncbi:uncharacterized protein PODANS_5_7160 [Podospora anserina S mat+]|uniref:Podospora anserina S mat+ genomic DNA chromosome 5, supercontig 8 n=5 Tax=Podospora TaxID=5144 RepID=B2AME8_PODAN|nr:uncharacterized protein PODANS_5_7160 [Podospora anserina S mat+]KAK4653423.1 hypothetical protein QC762_507160 [Podospora pseudocomata]KAK4664684.1 hypothetical protein QC763_507160 [Podospora pseudopauciseta]KAK4675833.1 hypothetical protein QC764_507160 [Podospora pseudoanserina]VBB81588.1 Putative protein of unknown function [Podospora comata]CAP65142.1 unnamed protein product [Podospora anserina S mat+]
MKANFLPVIALLLTPALAAPFAEPEAEAEFTPMARDMTPRAAFNEAEVFAFAPPASCKVLNCISVISSAVCVANAIDDDDYKAILKCAKKDQLCGCAGCFSKLNGFLEKWGIC